MAEPRPALAPAGQPPTGPPQAAAARPARGCTRHAPSRVPECQAGKATVVSYANACVAARPLSALWRERHRCSHCWCCSCWASLIRHCPKPGAILQRQQHCRAAAERAQVHRARAGGRSGPENQTGVLSGRRLRLRPRFRRVSAKQSGPAAVRYGLERWRSAARRGAASIPGRYVFRMPPKCARRRRRRRHLKFQLDSPETTSAPASRVAWSWPR